MSAEGAAAWRRHLRSAWAKYKFMLLVIAAGGILLILPLLGGEKQDASAQEPTVNEDVFSVEYMEYRLKNVLSRIEGAGEVDVVLTVKSGARRILAQDGKTTQRDGEVDSTISTVVLSNADRSEAAVSLQQLSPQYQGALVVCSGGDDPAVRLYLSEAVSVLTGLGTDKISICRGK